MDIVFPGNFQACLVWQSDGTGDNQAAFKIKHEYILVYSLDKTQLAPPPVIDPNIAADSKLYNDEKRNSIIKNGKKNPPSTLWLPAGFPAAFESGVIPPRCGENEWPKHSEPIHVADSRVVAPVAVTSGWSSKNLYERFIAQEFAPVIDDRNQLTSFELTKNGAIESYKPRPDKQSYVISVIRNVGSVQKAKADLERIGITFDYPKPPGLIEYLLKMVPGNDFVALDFFAGTGTTGEAVMELNDEDSGTRSFIMAASTEATHAEPEKNLARDACARRLVHYFSNRKATFSNRAELAGFSYRRIRKVRLGDVDRELLPANSWFWVQQLHGMAPLEYNLDLPVQIAETDGERVIYVDRATPVAIQATAAAMDFKPTFVYSWSPGRFLDPLADAPIELRAIPDYFAERLAR